MNRILVVGEDHLCCALGERLVAASLPGWTLAGASINVRGVTKLERSLPRFLEQANYVQPVLCIADTDGQCAVTLRARFLNYAKHHAPHESFLLRLAHSEAESWMLADREGFSKALNVPIKKLPHKPDEEVDPKRLVLNLARISKNRLFRTEVISNTDQNKPGSGYNLHLCNFVQTHWDARRGAEYSPSLARALKRVQALETVTRKV